MINKIFNCCMVRLVFSRFVLSKGLCIVCLRGCAGIMYHDVQGSIVTDSITCQSPSPPCFSNKNRRIPKIALEMYETSRNPAPCCPLLLSRPVQSHHHHHDKLLWPCALICFVPYISSSRHLCCIHHKSCLLDLVLSSFSRLRRTCCSAITEPVSGQAYV